MSVEEDDDGIFSHNQELDYDMWEGQFEFVGPTNNANVIPQGLLRTTPFLQSYTNGIKKNAAHRWCDQVNDNVRL